MLAWRIGALLAWGGSPTALGPKQASLPLPCHLPLPTLLPRDWGWGLGRRLRLALGGVELGGHGWQRGQRGRLGTGLGLAGVGLGGVAVGLGAGDALLLASPGVVVGGVADVVVHEGVRLLAVGIHLVFTVTTLRGG